MGIGRAPVTDGELAYEVTGGGRAVVLMHAGVLNMSMWDDQFALLAQQCRVVRYDARGHGRSTTPRQSFRHADDLRDLLGHLGIERATLVGLSLGARIAVDTALRHPGLVEGMLLVGPGVSGMSESDPGLSEARSAMEAAGRAADLAGFAEAMLRAWVDGPHRRPGDVDPGVRDRCRQMILDTLDRHASGEGDAIEEGAIDRLAEIRARTRTVLGELDSSDIVEVVDAIRSQAPGWDGGVVQPGAGHMVNLERPADFERHLVDFLAGATP